MSCCARDLIGRTEQVNDPQMHRMQTLGPHGSETTPQMGAADHG